MLTWEFGRYCDAAPAVRVPSAALARLKPLPGMCVRSCGPLAVAEKAAGFVVELHCHAHMFSATLFEAATQRNPSFCLTSI